MGYEMYRLLSSKKPHLQKQPKSRKKGSQVIDVDEEDRDKNLLVGGYICSHNFCNLLFGCPAYLLL